MIGAKSDAETCGIEPARRLSANVELRQDAFAKRLVTDGPGERIVAVDVGPGDTEELIRADLFIVSCGAVNSAALLLRSGVGNSSGLVGRNYMAHLATMFSAYRWDDVDAGPHRFQKTIGINDYYLANGSRPYPLGHIQSQGTIHPEMVWGGASRSQQLGLKLAVKIHRGSLKHWTRHSMQWLTMSEDLRVCLF
jgi:choline dehydrogenase-like flavoprotein